MVESSRPPAGYVHSLERGLAVIRRFSAERPRLTLSEVARQTGLSEPRPDVRSLRCTRWPCRQR